MEYAQIHFSLILLLFLFLLPYKSIFARKNVVSDSVEVILADSVALDEDGFQEVVKEQFIEDDLSWIDFIRLHIVFYFTGILFWIALILFLVYKLFRYFFKEFSERNKGG
jgi:hypothetical protein